MLGVLHPLDRRLDGVDPRLDPPRGNHLPRRLGSGVNLSKLRSSKEQLSKGGYASVRSASCAAPTLPPARSSRAARRGARKMVVLDIDHPDIEEFIWCKAKEEEKARVLEQAGYDMSLDSSDWASIQYQNANNSVRITDAFMEAVEANEDWNLTAHRRDGREDRARAQAPEAGGRRGLALRRSRHPVRHDDQLVARSRTRGASTRPTRAASTCPSTTRPATSPR